MLQNQSAQIEAIVAAHRKAKEELVKTQKEIIAARKEELDARANREIQAQKELREREAAVYQ